MLTQCRAVLTCFVFVLAAKSLPGQTNQIFKPGVPTPFTFYCQDAQQRPAANCQITLIVRPLARSNGHLHELPPGYTLDVGGYPSTYHPRSGLCVGNCSASASYGVEITGCSNSSGAFTFTVLPTLVGQIEILKGTSTTQGNCNGATQLGDWQYAVGYSDLRVGTYPLWKPVGGSDTGGDSGHGTTALNQWMMQDTYVKLITATVNWHAQSGNCKICTNDAALPLGGKFNILAVVPARPGSYAPDPFFGPYHPWTSPHSQHDRGSAVDVNGSGNQGCQTPVDADLFVRACELAGFGRAGLYSFNEGNHAHCGLALTFPR